MSVKIIDLARYQKLALPNGVGCGVCQHQASFPAMRPSRYSIYTDDASSACDVTYYRLCHKLGLKCIEASFGVNLPQSGKQYVSASELSLEWKQHGNLSDPALLTESVHAFLDL